MTEHSTFRANILFACVDEVYLINEWGPAFRLAFGNIGTFLRGRFPTSMYIVGLTATLEPGCQDNRQFLSEYSTPPVVEGPSIVITSHDGLLIHDYGGHRRSRHCGVPSQHRQ